MKISNKKAYFDYQILETFEAGINLYGSEVKAVRLGRADLTGSFVRIIGAEAYLINAKIFPYQYSRPENYDEQRTRKLLLHKKEIRKLIGKTAEKGLTLVPLKVYFRSGLAKVELGICRGKRSYDKRAAIAKRENEREMRRQFSRRDN